MKRCLIVDDAYAIRLVAARILENHDITVDEASSGEIALRKCEAAMPDAIMLDWHMPGMDGLEFLGLLRERPGGRMPKVLICATENDAVLMSKARRAGADGYMLKPFNSEMVVEKFRDLGLISAARAA